ncbi:MULTISPECIES: hypothetical protein [Streptomyces]|uniref:Uncharacterized protein n=1 Tax=Streptomyces clavifer TaxID=68188 RepID=A0ABS4VBH7_9ACTN|nr:MULTISPECIES: hypothetical protein [Streptomyces]MBP2361263.1 hypothetical protein [Streptomyces clavifer]MDX2748518.1 hypothetical protein [Streptomyces sp. NRRL_B-2557]WRY82206.1 hypothetical protein OG388_13660 [Streptomyces clavifer]WUC27976.1 hypothetical protein OG927_11615 [Streptomyces clavifer]GHA94146.1 hypothetical protein GCM10010392_20940 [Streptomyces clavifer]
MSDDQPIRLEGIPVFTGNLATLDVKVTELTSAAETVATTTGDIHSSFGGLQAFYQAPEADQLFATTKPVADNGQTLKSDLTAIAGALSTYSDEVHPLVEKLRQIKRDAGAFLVKVNADDKWREDGDLVEENNHRRDEIAETLSAFQDAEITCYNKITALVCLLPLKKSDGSDSSHQYGYDAESLKQAEGLPWGDPLVESTPGWQVWEHAWDFTKGFFVDGVLGTIKGLGTLVGYDGFEAAGQAWKGLAQLSTGLLVTVVAGPAYWTAKDDELPSWLRDSRTAMKETGKALVAWDQWGENPSRAAGAVTFNVVTTVFTGGTGGVVAGGGKAALAAKALSTAGKVGRLVDPMTYIFKGAGFGMTKIGDAMTGLKGLGTVEIPPLPDNVFTLPEGAVRLTDGTIDLPAGAALPEGAVRLADGTVRLPEGVIALPEGTVKNPFDEGAAYADHKGNLYDESGNLVQRGSDAHKETGKTADGAENPRVDNPARVPEMAGVGARAGDDAGPTSTTGHASDSSQSLGSSGHGPGSDGGPGGGDRTETPDGQVGSSAPDPDGVSIQEAADMATRRDFEARVSPESTIPAPPKEPGDFVLETGDPVYFSEGRTAIGYDRSTRVNFDNVRPLNGYHDVVVHGNNQGFFEPGRINEAGSGFSAGDTHPTHIANAIRANPGYGGGPVRLVSCHTGTVAEGALDVPAAQSIANELGVPVMAPTNKVGVSIRLGPGQTPTIFDGGYWRTFLPLAR